MQACNYFFRMLLIYFKLIKYNKKNKIKRVYAIVLELKVFCYVMSKIIYILSIETSIETIERRKNLI